MTRVIEIIFIYICFLLLISMLWHRQAIFESKGAKLSSSAECRIRTQDLRHIFASRLNACWQTGWAIEDQAKNLNSTARPYNQQATYIHIHIHTYTYIIYIHIYTYKHIYISHAMYSNRLFRAPVSCAARNPTAKSRGSPEPRDQAYQACMLIVSPRSLTGNSTELLLLPWCLSNLRAIGKNLKLEFRSPRTPESGEVTWDIWQQDGEWGGHLRHLTTGRGVGRSLETSDNRT